MSTMMHSFALKSDSTLGRRGGLFARLRRAVSDYRAYRRTCDEMNALTEDELCDLHISRYDIRAIARSAVYGH